MNPVVKKFYLYVKTHNVTGLKYLGQTSQDPFKYSGSGVYWRLHLDKHGSEHFTEILKECNSKEELQQLGSYYSELWRIVESNEWANLKPETGDGGSTTESKLKGDKTKLERYGTLNFNTDESIEKMLATRIKNGTNIPTSISRQKMVETKRKNGTLSPTQQTIEKILVTKRKNGTLNTRTKEVNDRCNETRRKNDTLNPNKIQVTCPHCGTTMGKLSAHRYHFDKCKHKPI
jgi:hypothetical protein